MAPALAAHLKATHRSATVKRASGASAPVAALLVRSISSSDFPTVTVTRMAVRSRLFARLETPAPDGGFADVAAEGRSSAPLAA
jgi:hypothetical protein